MARLHLKFRNFRPSVLSAATAVFDARPWAMETAEDKAVVGQAFMDAVSSAYRVPAARFGISPARAMRDFNYRPAIMEVDALAEDDTPTMVEPPQVWLHHWSIVTLFQVARVHVLAQGGVEAVNRNDPQSWSCSLFYSVRPKMFRARVREGRIPGVLARDTYSEESWSKLVEAHLTFGDRLVGSPEQWRAALNGEPIPVMEQPVEDAFEALLDDEDLVEFFDSLPDAEETDEPEEEGPADEQECFETPEDVTDDGLDALNRDAIRVLAATHNIQGRGRMNVDTLRAALRQRGVRA